MTTEREKLAAEHPDAWIPVSTGEFLEGEVTDLNIGYSELGDRNYPILTVATNNGLEIKVFGFATALHNEIYTKQPIPGERVTITYHGQGEAKTKGQSAPEIYRMRVHNRSPQAYARMYGLLAPRGNGVAARPPMIEAPRGLGTPAGELTA